MTKKALARIGAAAVLTGSATQAHPAQARLPTIRITAPVWHTGEWWRVRVPLLTSSLGADQVLPAGGRYIRDSLTSFTIYRCRVVGQETLTYEEQDGPKHIGQIAPPEKCWVVTVTPEAQRDRQDTGFYRLFFRVNGLSLRQVHFLPGSGQKADRGWFMYHSTFVNDDDEAKPMVVIDRGPTRMGGGEPPILDWPRFPLDTSVNYNLGRGRANRSHQEFVPQSVAAVDVPIGGAHKLGLSVKIGGSEATVQKWISTYPWWVSSERGGLYHSRLIETSDGGLVP